jgi:hexosaminidase
MIRKIFIVVFFPLILFVSFNSRGQYTKTLLKLMPYPEKVVVSEGKFRLDSNFTIGITGKPDKRIYSYATRVLQRLENKTVILAKQGYLAEADSSNKASFLIHCNGPGKVEMGMDESYSLTVTTDKIELSSPTDIGALRGMETFLQMISSDEKGYYIPCVKITDKPRFQWRGLLIDVCRHFYPVDMLKRNIDGLAAVKMNVLHLHITEDQGFRIESKKFPKLHLLGSHGLFYTQEQIKDIIAYAADRGIRVVPEFDMPGHTSSWFVGYPQLASSKGPYKIEEHFGVFGPSMNPTKKYTYKFLSAFIEEMAALFPDEYFHIGGDENNGEEWDKNEDIQKFMKKNNIKSNDELQKYFNQNVLKIITKNKKKMMGWDEIFQPGLPKDIMIQSWRGLDYMTNSAKKGYQTILSSGYYIDLSRSAEEHYLNDPLPDTVNLDESQKKLILGGEATMWAELTTDEIVDSRIWPRTAAIAERLWSPSSVKDVDDMFDRLDVISLQLEEVGLTHLKNSEMMMRRLVGNDSIAVLKTFIDAVVPWKGYKRHSKGIGYSTSTPHSRVADISVPDEPVARHFNRWVKTYLETPDDSLKQLINLQLTIWKENDDKMQVLITKVPALKEISPVSENLSIIASVGIECMKYISTKQKPEESWLLKQQNIFSEAKKPLAEVDIAIIPAIQKMLDFLK